MAVYLPGFLGAIVVAPTTLLKGSEMSNFKASVQYGDFKGTAAADNADGSYDLNRYLAEKGFKKKNEFLVATSLWVGESAGGKLGHVHVAAYLYNQSDEHDTVKAALDAAPDPIPVRVVDLELSIEEYVSFFKRFSIMLTRPGLNIEGREYTTE